jgi:ferritin-like metal-binding protein YciE
MKELKDLFLDELADIYYAEGLLVKSLPKMMKAAQSEGLKEALESHLEETKTQVERLHQVFKAFGKPAKGKKCEAMVGLIEEGKGIMEDWKGSPALDAGLICAAQKVEHYEIASYGCLCTWAELLGNEPALKLLRETMDEEETADKKLTEIAESSINGQAAGDSEWSEPPQMRLGRDRQGSHRKQLVK